MISILPVPGLPEINEGDDLGRLIAVSADLSDGDVVVVAHKIVSKAEGRVVRQVRLRIVAHLRHHVDERRREQVGRALDRIRLCRNEIPRLGDGRLVEPVEVGARPRHVDAR